METDDELARLPDMFVDRDLHRMRCQGDRCSALAGQVGSLTSCRVYDLRPDVCRSCVPGDDACRIARQHFNLATALAD